MLLVICIPAMGQNIKRKQARDIPKALLPNAIEIEEKLKLFSDVTDAFCWHYQDGLGIKRYYFVQVFLENGDVLEFHSVDENLCFEKSFAGSGGLYRINTMSFYIRKWILWFRWTSDMCIPGKYLASAMNSSSKYDDIPSILLHYDEIKSFLVTTPYINRNNFISKHMEEYEFAFYKYKGSFFEREERGW